MRWQRRARHILAAVAIVSAVAVAVSLRPRPSARRDTPVERTDPKAMVESAGGHEIRVNREREEVRVNYDKLLTYPDGTSKMLGVRVVTERAGGRIFRISGSEGQVGDKESTVTLNGGVHVTASDGLELTTDHATYTKADGIVTAPGAVEFSRGRMRGSGTAFTFDNNRNILTITRDVAVTVAPDKSGAGAMQVAAGALQFLRNDRAMHFDGRMKAVRGNQTIEADTAVAHLSEDEQRLEALELRGNSRITAGKPTPGGLESLTGRDIDLTYSPDGLTLRRAVITAQAAMQLAGDAGTRAGRQIAGGAIDVSLAADGATPVGLTARESVHITLPATDKEPDRTVQSQTLDAKGDEGHGLTSAHLTGNVQFAEARNASAGGRALPRPDDPRCQTGRGQGAPAADAPARLACAGVLDLALAGGFGSIDDARFAQNVRFFDADLMATAASIRYAPGEGMMELRGTEPAVPMPHIVNPQLTIDAVRIDVTLDGPEVNASGSVKSVLQGKKPGSSSDTRMPSMLKADQPVNVTANQLAYSGTASRAVYTGAAQLWQGDTAIKGSAITIDSKSGDLVAEGPVTTTSVMVQENDDGTRERVRSSGSARDFHYDDAARRATYTGDAHLNGPQGDTTAPRIELYLKESGDEVDRAEAYDGVVLRDENRKTTGNRLTYHSADESYLVTGTPVTVVDECGRETLARTLTFFRATDRIIVDGNEQVRTQTKGKSNCP